MKYLIVITVLLITFYGRSQTVLEEDYFSDSIPGSLTEVFSSVELDNGIIISGSMITPSGTSQGVVLRLNLIGEVVWSTLSQLTQPNCSWVRHMKLFSDGYIYSYSCGNFWKVDVNNGHIEWITPYNYYINNDHVDLEDYDSSTFLVTYRTSQFDAHVAFVDKFTGDTLSSTPMEYGDDIYQKLVVDPYGNIFYGSGSTLHKFNGDNLDFRIWKKSYNTDQNDPYIIETITKLYCDAYGDIFIFGYDDNSSTNLILAKVSPMDGSVIWKTPVAGNKSLQGFVDKFGHLYMTFQHKYVGGILGDFTAAKLNKSSGVVNWLVYQDMSPLASICGSQESANSLDVDCNGDIYLSGYYGDDNYGPGLWGIMKLLSPNGAKEYELTIIQDSLNCDNVSEGVGVALIRDSPIIVGNEEVAPWETKATFVALDTSTGLPNIRHHIGADYQHFSSTIDIQNSNNSMFLLMQNGEHASLRMSTTFGVADWEFIDVNSDKTRAGCISVNSNSVYLTVNRFETDNLPPGIFDSTNAILFFELDRNTGAVIQQDSLLISGNIQLIEMESDTSDAAYLLYADGTNVKLIRWDGNGLSSPVILAPISENVQSKRPLNLLDNYSSSEILFSGEQNLYSVDKNTLQLTSLYTYPSSRNIYSLIHENENVVLSGNDDFGFQSIISIDTTSFSLNWDQTYQSGVFAGAINYLDTIYTYGEVNGQIQVKSIVASTGISGWEYIRPNISGISAVAYDLSFSPGNERFVVNGAENHLNGSSDVTIDRLDRSGNGSSLLHIPDELSSQSFAYCSSSQFDSLLWIGGRVNRTSYGKQGVNYLIKFYECPLISGIDIITACDSYTWIDGNTYTASNSTATHTLNNIAGCDSVVTLNLTINSVNNSVTQVNEVLTANETGATYQWLDCLAMTPISGATSQSYIVTVNGDYAVTTTNNGCSDTSVCYSITNVEIFENDFGNDLQLYPNPTDGNFSIDLGESYNDITITITDLNGKIIQSKKYNESQLLKLKLEEPAGVYLLLIESRDKKAVIRLVKQ